MRILLLTFTAIICAATTGAESPVIRVGILAGGESEFWTAMHDAMREAAKEQNIEIDFRMPSPATAERQDELAREMIAAGARALAVCPLNPEALTPLLDELTAKAPIITLLRDAPESKRAAFIGRNEEEIGRLMARGVLQNLPEGVKIMGFCNKQEAPETQRRIAGFKKTLDETMMILDAVKEDQGDRMIAKANMEDVLSARPEIAALIGFERYHVPAMIHAVIEGGRARMVRIIGVGPAPGAAEYLKQGIVHVLVEDDAAGCGALALQTLIALAKGETDGLPENGFIAAPLVTLKAAGAMSLEEMMNELQVQAPWVSEVTFGAP